jgi:acetyl-CoA carboxylase carboxyl transferase subunit beta
MLKNFMAVEGWFGNKSKFQGSSAARSAAAVPDGVAVKCAKCSEILFAKEFEKSLKVCSKCGHHHRITAQERIDYTVDPGTFAEFATEIVSEDPLKFPKYRDKLEQAWSKIGRGDAFRVGRARIGGQSCVLGVSEFGFRGGSMGSATGEKISLALEVAIEENLPVVFFTSSGGARMEEGLISLMQMAKTSAMVAYLGSAGLPLIVVMCDPTVGGVPASYASLGDFQSRAR